MDNIKWEDGAVCFSYGEIKFSIIRSSEYHFSAIDFQLNEIRQGDYIEASELDTERKYNDAVEVFGLFGFNPYLNYDLTKSSFCSHGHDKSCGLVIKSPHIELVYNGAYDLELSEKRKLTYPQLMAIGKLKRAMIGRDETNDSELPNSSNCKTSKDYLNECIEVQNQRGEQYDSKGTGERSFAAAASAFNAMTGQSLKGSDVCLLLSCVKAVRQYSDPTRVHEDSLLDLVSYAALWAEEISKELK